MSVELRAQQAQNTRRSNSGWVVEPEDNYRITVWGAPVRVTLVRTAHELELQSLQAAPTHGVRVAGPWAGERGVLIARFAALEPLRAAMLSLDRREQWLGAWFPAVAARVLVPAARRDRARSPVEGQ